MLAARGSFHNTIGAAGRDLQEAEFRAGSQEIAILSFFKSRPARMFTPSEIHKRLFDPITTPLTSVRRAITNLTRAGYLLKTDIKTTGPYGMPEHCWYLPAPRTDVKPTQLELFGG